MKKVILSFVLLLAVGLWLTPHPSYATGLVVDLVSPSYGKVLIVPVRPLFRWQPVVGATTYVIQVHDHEFPPDPFRTEMLEISEAVESTSYQAPENLHVNLGDEVWYWRVRAVTEEHGVCPWSGVNTFKVWPSPEPGLRSPVDGARLSITQPTFTWHDARHYGEHRDKIQVSTEASFRTILFEDELTVDEIGRFVLPTQLDYGQTYYWRVRFEDMCRHCIWFNPEEMGMPGRWSEVRQFEVFLGVPSRVFLERPARGERVSASLTLTWNPISTATNYMVLLSDEEDCSHVVNRLFPSSNSVRVVFREPDGRYYWKVRASNEAGYGEWSDIWNFYKTSELPNQVTLREPEDGAVLHSATPLWRWEQSGYRGDAFHLQVSDVSHFATTTIDEDSISGEIEQFHSPVNLQSHTTYYWRVRKRNTVGWGPWSEVRDFRVDLSTTSAARVTLASPDEGESLDETTIYFRWNSDPSYCVGYQLQIAHDRGFEKLFSDRYSTGRSTRVYVPDAGKTYYWRVRAQDEIGWGRWSGVRSFHTRSVRWDPELFNPQGSVDRTKPEFSWEGLRGPTAFYRLQVSTDPDFRFLVLDKADVTDTRYLPRRDLPAGARYYWRVRGRSSRDRRWTSTDNFETFWIQLALSPVMLLSPENGVILRTTMPRFSWRSEMRGGEDESELAVSDHRDFSTTVFRTSTTGHSLVSPRNLSDGTYCWRVRQRLVDVTGWGAWSEARCFTIDITPPEIDITEPRKSEISTATIPARVVVSCEVTDNLAGVNRVEYYLSRRSVASRTRPHHGSTYIAAMTGLREGRNTITIKAYDNSGPRGNFSTASFELEIKRVLGIQKKEPLVPKKHRLPTSPMQEPLQEGIKKDMQRKMYDR